jgi:xanthine dehydrogenase YagT iron-sulfur-binding subunit
MSDPSNPLLNREQRDDQSREKFSLAAQSLTRREFIGQLTVAGTGILIAENVLASNSHGATEKTSTIAASAKINVNFTLNGAERNLTIDPRTTLLDALRNELAMPGTKKGCDHGQCGACTVLMDNRRINSCLMFAAMCQGAQVTTIEGLAQGNNLHPVQTAFIKHDAFQCGYCTPGQICSAVGLLKEGHAHSDAEIRELMSGNICRCGAYQNILAAIKEAQSAA